MVCGNHFSNFFHITPPRPGLFLSTGQEFLERGRKKIRNCLSSQMTVDCQLTMKRSGVGAWQRPAQSSSSSVGLDPWVLECVRSHQRSGMVSREACCNSSVPGPQPWPTLRLLLPLPTLTLQWIPKKSQLPTQEIEKLPRLPTQGPWVGGWNAQWLTRDSCVKQVVFKYCRCTTYWSTSHRRER